MAAHEVEGEALLLLNGFYAVLCPDHFRIGRKLNRRSHSLGAKLLIATGLSFNISLGTRTVDVLLVGNH